MIDAFHKLDYEAQRAWDALDRVDEDFEKRFNASQPRDAHGKFKPSPHAAERAAQRAAQRAERHETRQRHQAAREDLKGRHAAERASISGKDARAQLVERHAAERKGLRETHAGERSTLAEKHAEQRKALINPSAAPAEHSAAGGIESSFEPKTFKSASAADEWAREDFKDWGKKLSRQERLALLTYQGGEFRQINNALRSSGEPPKKYAKTVKDLDAAIAKKAIGADVTVYRGMNLSDPAARAVVDKWEPGATFQDKAYISTSLDRKLTHETFADPSGATIEIRVPKGSHGAYMNAANDNPHLASEKELLLPRSTQYRVVSKTPRGRGFHVVLEVAN